MRKLEDADEDVRVMALQTLQTLDAQSLARYDGAIVKTVDDSHWRVRRQGLETLAGLHPSNLADHVSVPLHVEGCHRATEHTGPLSPQIF